MRRIQRNKNSITKRWIVNTLCMIVVVLLGITAVATAMFREQYYASVRMTLQSRATGMVSSYFSLYTEGSGENFNLRAKEFVQDFSEKSLMEVWVIDAHGNVVVSSGGFSVRDEPFPDYTEAKNSPTGKAEWVGRMTSGEKVMALTYVLPSLDGSPSGAVRYIISLRDVDNQIITVFFLLLLLDCIVLAGMAASGRFFIKSIVNPLKKINETAKNIAAGDLTARIEEHRYDDEIGQLCETINDMASEIKATEQLKNEFISTVSHELRTPLTAIKGWGETIQQAGEEDKELTQKGIDIIVTESERLTHLVEELLDFSRMASGGMSISLSPIDVLKLLDDAVFVFKDRSARDGIQLLYEAPTATATMNGDADRIKQVFVNILDNAFKYTKAGGTVTVLTAENRDKSLCISFADTGCGIPKADLPRVKEKFYKANRSVRGSGIGLAVVSEILRLHGGSFSIESTEGKGTTVTVILPAQFGKIYERG